jgi:hypothetical protein
LPVSGVITINIPNCKIDEYDIYIKYIKNYPNLKIIFSDNIKDKVTFA